MGRSLLEGSHSLYSRQAGNAQGPALRDDMLGTGHPGGELFPAEVLPYRDAFQSC